MYPIGHPYTHNVEVKNQLCDYCHQQPPKYMVAGKTGKKFDLICQECYNKTNQIAHNPQWRINWSNKGDGK